MLDSLYSYGGSLYDSAASLGGSLYDSASAGLTSAYDVGTAPIRAGVQTGATVRNAVGTAASATGKAASTVVETVSDPGRAIGLGETGRKRARWVAGAVGGGALAAAGAWAIKRAFGL